MSLRLLCLLPLLMPVAAFAQGRAAIVEIVFEGNEVTVPETLRREISVREGDELDEAALEHSRQAIQDLGLFRAVSVSHEAVTGGERVKFTVKEKFYLLLYPRLSANTDGQNSYGLELRWNNLFGRNHSLRLMGRSRDSRDPGRGRDLRYSVGYSAPFLWDSPYSLSVFAGRQESPYEEPMPYDETVNEAGFLMSRKFNGGPAAASQGWSAGAGLKWSSQTTEGPLAPAPYGDAVSLLTEVNYRDFRDRIFGDGGERYGLHFEIADRNYGSDYSYTKLTADYKRVFPLGGKYEDLVFAAELGSSNNGPAGRVDFSLGGTQGLRGFDRNFAQGNFYYLTSLEYLRPLHWDWLRLALVLEAGNAHEDADAINDHIYSNIGIGLRARFPRLVDFEFEAGLAFPLQEGGGMRFYGDRIGRD